MKKLFVILTVLMLGFVSCQESLKTPEVHSHHHDHDIEKRQAHIDGWTPRPCVDITICIDGACGPDWTTGVQDAIDAYNAVGIAQISMQTGCVDPDVTINCGPLTCCHGLGEWPIGDGTIGSTIFLNAADEGNACGACWFQGIVMHEIGHNLGIVHGQQEDVPDLNTGPWTVDASGAHTQVDTSNGADAVWIPGTPHDADDENSIFNSPFQTCNDPVCTFSGYDMFSLAFLYPAIGLNGTEVLCEGEVGTYCISGIGDGVDAEIVWNTLGGQNGDTENCREYSFTDPGTYTISAQVCFDFDCCVDVSTTVYVGEEEPNGGKCYCICDAIDTYNDTPYTEYIEIDCCDPRGCAEIISDYHGDVIINFKKDCLRRVNPCTGPLPEVSLTGPDEVCEEEGYVTICVSGYTGPTSWTISGPNGNDSENSSHNCLPYDVEPGTYYFSTTICEGDCCIDLTHTVIVTPGPCEEECYCICEEGDGEGNYTTVELPIDCNEDCDEIYPVGDEYFDCRKMVR